MRRSERFPSRFVQASDLKPGGVTVTMNVVRMEEIGQGADKKTKPVLYFKNASKAMVPLPLLLRRKAKIQRRSRSRRRSLHRRSRRCRLSTKVISAMRWTTKSRFEGD